MNVYRAVYNPREESYQTLCRLEKGKTYVLRRAENHPYVVLHPCPWHFTCGIWHSASLFRPVDDSPVQPSFSGASFGESLKKMNPIACKDPYAPKESVVHAHRRLCTLTTPDARVHYPGERRCSVIEEESFRRAMMMEEKLRIEEKATAWARRQKNDFGVCSMCLKEGRTSIVAPRAIITSLGAPVTFYMTCTMIGHEKVIASDIDPSQFA